MNLCVLLGRGGTCTCSLGRITRQHGKGWDLILSYLRLFIILFAISNCIITIMSPSHSNVKGNRSRVVSKCCRHCRCGTTGTKIDSARCWVHLETQIMPDQDIQSGQLTPEPFRTSCPTKLVSLGFIAQGPRAPRDHMASLACATAACRMSSTRAFRQSSVSVKMPRQVSIALGRSSI